MPAFINLAEWDNFKDDLKRFVEEEQKLILKRAVTAVGVQIDQIARDALPPEPRRKAVAKYWTPRQRRWWWATMRKKASGESRALPGWKAAYRIVNGVKTLDISGAYRRTGTGVKSLSYQIDQPTTHTTTLRYGTNRDYMRYVIDEEKQSKYHENNWPTLQGIIREHLPKLQKTFEDTLYEEINKVL